MYHFLSSHLPGWAADLLTAIWYAGLIALVAYYSFEPQAQFSYANF